MDNHICDGKPDDINFNFNGANGMTYTFKCSNNKIYVVKFMYEYQQYYEQIIQNDVKSTYIRNIVEEYNSINMFNHKNIMKAYAFFIYDNKEYTIIKRNYIDNNNYCEINKIANDKIINLDDDNNKEYKQDKLIPFHGGIILEHVQNSFNDIKKVANLKIISNLFLGYLKGIQYMYTKNYIHNDIKKNNLMFNIIKTNKNIEYEAKIIDFGGAYNFSVFTKEFAPTSTAYALSKYYNDLKNLTSTAQLFYKNKKEIKTIASKYDLYSLAYVFNDNFSKIIIQNIKFTLLIMYALTEKIDINEAIDYMELCNSIIQNGPGFKVTEDAFKNDNDYYNELKLFITGAHK